MKGLFLTVLLLLHLPVVFSDTHSLRYHYTLVSAPGPGLPEFSVTGYVDGLVISFYSSDVGRTVPVAPWMESHVPPEEWERQTWVDVVTEVQSQHEAKIVMSQFRKTEAYKGDVVFQAVYGCDLRDGSSASGFFTVVYDRKNFITLDTETGKLIPWMPQANITAQKWNSPEERLGEKLLEHLQTDCISAMKTFLKYGREDLERKVQPQVKVTGHKPDEVTKLHCLVYGFYPRDVIVRWMKNEKDDIPSNISDPILPNADGTYQIRVSVEVIPREGDTYSCYVDHSSLEEPLLVPWGSKTNVRARVIIGVFSGLVVLIGGFAGFLIHKKKNLIGAAAGNRAVKLEEFPMS